MEPGLVIEKIEFADGSELPLKPGSVTIVTGPNNSGKSTFLRDLDKHFGSGRGKNGYSGVIAKKVETKLHGTAKEFLERFHETEPYDAEEDRFKFEKGYSGNSYKASTLRSAIAKGKLPNPVEASFRKFLPAHERLHGTGYNNTIEAAINQIFSNEAREIALSDIFRRSFGIDLILDRTRKEGIFYIADRKDLAPHDQRLTPEFRKWVEGLPALRQQGDGMRSFARLLIEIFVKRQSVLIVDEPELFLHPPQIRQLAGVVVNEKPDHSQIFVATHSDDFVKGVLDTEPKDLNFIRLTRSAGKAEVRYLQNDDVKHLWSDPLLRTSNALSALFHQFTIVCEGESDARFLRWALDDLMSDDASIDYFITHCGGKQKMGGIVKSIGSIGASVLSFCDIDVLNDKTVFRKLFEAHGGTYADVSANHDLILRRVAERRTDVSGHYFWSELDRIKQGAAVSDNISSDTSREIATLLRRSSPWGRIKEDGAVAFVDSESLAAFRDIRGRSADLGLFINPEGELESLCRAISRSNKTTWLNEVLERPFSSDGDLATARQIVSELAQYMRSHCAKVF